MSRQSANVSERRIMPPIVGVSTVLFALSAPRREAADAEQGSLWLPLVRRVRPPFLGEWALPGGVLPWNESLEDAARQTLRSATGVSPAYLEQLATFGAVERSASDQRLVTVAYWALQSREQIGGAVVPDNVAWHPAEALPTLAFDHRDIVENALWRLRSRMSTSAVAHLLLGNTFTIAQLRHVHEAVRGRALDPANFRRQVLSGGDLVEVGVQRGARHRPARLYRFAGSPFDRNGVA